MLAVVNVGALKSALLAGKLCKIYFLFGNDAYLKKQYADKIINMTTDRSDVFNYMPFSADCNMGDVYDAVLQVPLMSDKKCVVLCDYDFEKADKQSFETLKEIIESTPESTVFIIWCNNFEFDFKKSDRARKIAAAIDKCGGTSVQIDHPTAYDLKKMLISGAAKRGITFQSGAAEYLIENCSDDINTLRYELEKLCSYAKASGVSEITRAIIDSVTVKSLEASVFELSKKIFAMDISGAMALLDELFYLKTEAAVILHSVFSSFIDAYRVFSAETAGVKIPQIAADFNYGRREFVLSQIRNSAMRMDNKKFNLCFEEIISADAALKSFSGSERTVLEELAVKLIYIISKGEKIDKN